MKGRGGIRCLECKIIQALFPAKCAGVMGLLGPGFGVIPSPGKRALDSREIANTRVLQVPHACDVRYTWPVYLCTCDQANGKVSQPSSHSNGTSSKAVPVAKREHAPTCTPTAANQRGSRNTDVSPRQLADAQAHQHRHFAGLRTSHFARDITLARDQRHGPSTQQAQQSTQTPQGQNNAPR
jgi:hypothetical protein